MSSVLKIDGHIYLSISVEDSPIQTKANLINSLSIHESVRCVTPVMQFVFNDYGLSLERDLRLVEGTKVQITIGKTEDNLKTGVFRMFGQKKIPHREGPNITATFVLDAPKYITESYSATIKGTSSEVIKKIASECGLKPDVVETKDSMLWRSPGYTRAVFSEEVASHGFIDETSCMARALTVSKKLRYKNLFDQIYKEKPTAVFSYNSPIQSKAIPVAKMRDYSDSGVFNNWLNYGWNYYHHTSKGKTEKIEKMEIKTDGMLPLNSEIKEKVKKSRIEHSGKIDCGNTHSDYNKAYYQNLRGAALFTQKIHILIESPSNVEVLDVVELYSSDTDGTRNSISGRYLVEAKVIALVSGIHYCERLVLIRVSVSSSGKTPLIG